MTSFSTYIFCPPHTYFTLVPPLAAASSEETKRIFGEPFPHFYFWHCTPVYITYHCYWYNKSPCPAKNLLNNFVSRTTETSFLNIFRSNTLKKRLSYTSIIHWGREIWVGYISKSLLLHICLKKYHQNGLKKRIILVKSRKFASG